MTDRDRAICHTLYEHRVLTTEQLYELHFDGLERARKRLTQLQQLQLLDRFRPHRQQGSSPYHYLLGELGAQLVASDRGIDPDELDWARAGSLRLASSQQLTHLIEASGFFTHLAHATRTSDRGELVAWWGQRRCARAWGEIVRPDGYARLRLGREELEVWVEWDRGTEQHARLAEKLDRYEEFAVALERTVTLLIVLHSDRREREVRRSLRAIGTGRVLTSTAARHRTDPLGRNWLPVDAEHRVMLAQLAAADAGTCRDEIFPRQADTVELADLPGSSAGPTCSEPAPTQAHTYNSGHAVRDGPSSRP